MLICPYAHVYKSNALTIESNPPKGLISNIKHIRQQPTMGTKQSKQESVNASPLPNDGVDQEAEKLDQNIRFTAKHITEFVNELLQSGGSPMIWLVSAYSTVPSCVRSPSMVIPSDVYSNLKRLEEVLFDLTDVEFTFVSYGPTCCTCTARIRRRSKANFIVF